MQKITLTYIIAFLLSFISYSDQRLEEAPSFYGGVISDSLLAEPDDAKLLSEIPNQVSFKQPDYGGDAPSGRDRGTGSRGDCMMTVSGKQGTLTLTPLIPSDSRGLTVQESPTIWIQVDYKPKKISDKLLAEFSLEDAQTSIKLAPKRISVTLPQTTNVFSIPIPHSLEVNKWYRWYLVLDCGSDNSDSVLAIEGMVQRVSLSGIENQLNTQSPQENFWYDALNKTAILHCSNPQNTALREPWIALLRNVGLDKIALTPLICPD
ncbi:MAG: DUF928 domain-containing protein [Xenococcaceae cyanobacterium MO_167.B52]|nr:DUF928 domain-containing protein [Xenococcaceae cyanobacterium MO_167.B52]